MKKFEYKTKIIESRGVWLFRGGKVNVSKFDEMLNEMGQDGWEMVEATPSTQASGSTRYIVCIFKRGLE